MPTLASRPAITRNTSVCESTGSSDEVVAAVGKAGYKYAYTACPHEVPAHPLLTIERLLLWEGSSVDGLGEFSSDILNCQVHDLWPPARRCGRLHHS